MFRLKKWNSKIWISHFILKMWFNQGLFFGIFFNEKDKHPQICLSFGGIMLEAKMKQCPTSCPDDWRRLWDNLWERRGGSMVNGAPREVPESTQCTLLGRTPGQTRGHIQGQTKGLKPDGPQASRVFGLFQGSTLSTQGTSQRLHSPWYLRGFCTDFYSFT